jgi:SAM-dependent methyltransferase
MEQFIDQKLKLIKESSRKIVDLGAGGPDPLRVFFGGAEYITVDVDPNSGANCIADAHELPFPSASVDAVLAFSLIEHTHSPARVVDEIERILRPGGVALLSVPFLHPYHGGRCPDYYRFTKEGIRYLFRNFKHVEIQSDGGLFLALQYFIPRPLEPLRFVIDPVLKWLDLLFTHHRASAHQFLIFAQK